MPMGSKDRPQGFSNYLIHSGQLPALIGAVGSFHETCIAADGGPDEHGSGRVPRLKC